MPFCFGGIALGVIGLVAVTKRVLRHRFGYAAFAPCGPRGGGAAGCRNGYGGGGEEGSRVPWGRRGAGPGRSWWLRGAFAKLDTTPGQEREIRGAVEDFQIAVRASTEHAKEAKADLAKAITGDVFDDGAIGDASAKLDVATAQAKDAFTAALKRVHAVLDDKQRQRLAEVLAKGRPFGGGVHPYRA